jgi:hypothetical protein
MGGGATRICEDKNKMGLKWDVKVWLNSTGLRRGLL